MENIYNYIESFRCANGWHDHIHRKKKEQPVPEIEFVDLGLPSGTLWAKYNLGVNPNKLDTLEDYCGDYYSWGELTPKSDYSRSTYTYSDDPDVLPADHDVATVLLGEGCCIPTKNDIDELINNTENIMVISEYGYEGVELIGSNGNSIFIPASGYYDGTDLEKFYNQSYNWSSNKKSSSTAYTLLSESEGIDTDSSEKYIGITIRSIKKVSQ